MRYRKTSALLVLALALLLIFGAVGCAQSQPEQPESTAQETAEPVVPRNSRRSRPRSRRRIRPC